jgi:hypothetical protein
MLNLPTRSDHVHQEAQIDTAELHALQDEMHTESLVAFQPVQVGRT